MIMTSGPTDFKMIFTCISWSIMHQIGQLRTVWKSLESEEFKTVINCPIWCIFDQDICIKVSLKSVGPPVIIIFHLHIWYIMLSQANIKLTYVAYTKSHCMHNTNFCRYKISFSHLLVIIQCLTLILVILCF